MDWHAVDPDPLFESIRARGPAPDSERAVWAFEQALGVARVDGELLGHLLVACTCLLAFEHEETPRTILEQTFQRAVGDCEWRDRFAALLA